MKFGIFSDLHLEFDRYHKREPWKLNIEPDVFYLNAGDTDSNAIFRKRWLDQIVNPKGLSEVYSVLGNHDYYTLDFPDPGYGIVPWMRINGIKIVGATLWTDLSNYIQWGDYIHGLFDYSNIGKLTYENYNLAHQIQKKYLLSSKADIIISHHIPTYQFVSERFKGSIYNPGFMTELSEDILNMDPPPKLWICGHTHDPFDGYIGKTRIICHPRGYPGEISYENYQPKIVEI